MTRYCIYNNRVRGQGRGNAAYGWKDIPGEAIYTKQESLRKPEFRFTTPSRRTGNTP
jgi:hypothetical protein